MRAAQLLQVLARIPGKEWALTDIAAELDAAKSSTLTVCVALEDAGLIERRGSGYVLGREVLKLAGAYLSGFDQVRAFYDLCARDEVLSGLVVQIAMLDRADVLYLARHEGQAPYRMAAGIGSRFPASSTAVGHALLSKMEDSAIVRLFEEYPHFELHTAYSVRDIHELLSKVQLTRTRGYSVDREGVHPGLVGVAVPLDPWNSADAELTLGAALNAPEATQARIEEVGQSLQNLAQKLTNPLSFQAAVALEKSV